MAERSEMMPADRARRRTRIWGGATVALMAAIGLGVIAFNRPSPATVSNAAPTPAVSSNPTVSITEVVPSTPKVSSAPAVSSTAVERYAARILEAQKSFLVARKSYASTVEQLKLQSPPRGVTIDYRGSSPLGFCWLARSSSGVWYTISQRRVAPSEVAVTAPPPISCR